MEQAYIKIKKQMNMKMKYFLSIVIITVAAFGFTLCTPKSDKNTNFQIATVTKGTIINSITATGTIEPIIQVEVGTQVSGIISKIYVDFNSQVKKGQVLAELDRTTLEADLQSSEASLSSSKTEYEYQLKNFNRIKGLYDKKLISETDYESAKYSLDKAKSAFDKSQSDISRVRQNVKYATISSPIDGVVLNRAVDEGQTVAASFNTPTLFLIANDLKKMQVIAKIDEADIGYVDEGQKVEFSVDAYPGEIFSGAVTQVRLEPTTTSNVVTYEVVISAPNPDLKLKPGLTANVTITTQERVDVLTLPAKAFKFSPSNIPADKTKGRSVWIRDAKGTISRVEVRTGISDGVNTEIIEGLNEGDVIITGETTGKAAEVSAQQTTETTSPFMPPRPGGQQQKK